MCGVREREIIPQIERKPDPVVCFFQRTISRTTKTALQILEGCHSGPSNVAFSRPNISCFSNHFPEDMVFLDL